MIGGRERQARYASDFYRDYYHKTLNGLMILCFIILLLISGIIYLIVTQADPKFFATTLGGQIIPMPPKNE
jgi:hypothetical protein